MPANVLIFSAPSGAGKTTMVRHLLQKYSRLSFSVSATTRAPRQGEQEGRDYYFLSKEEFEQKISENAFIEYEQVYSGAYYGTLRSEVENLQAKGKIVLFDVDVVGGKNLKKFFGEQALSFFIKVPSPAVLEARLRRRNTESEESLQKRLAKAQQEMLFEPFFDIIVVNDILEESLQTLENHLQAILNP